MNEWKIYIYVYKKCIKIIRIVVVLCVFAVCCCCFSFYSQKFINEFKNGKIDETTNVCRLMN